MKQKRNNTNRRKQRVMFVVVSGEYSDWDLHGVCSTKRRANQLCKLLNKESGREGCDDGYRVEELPILDRNTGFPPATKMYTFWIGYDGRTLHDHEWHKGYCPIADIRNKPQSVKVINNKYVGTCDVEVRVPVDCTFERAQKIAQDILAEYKYRKAMGEMTDGRFK